MCIFDVWIADVYAKLHRRKKLTVVLKLAETAKKKKYLRVCQHQQQHFMPLVYLAEGMLITKMQAAEKLLQALAAKLEHPLLEMEAWVQQQRCIMIVCQAPLLLQGTWAERQYGG